MEDTDLTHINGWRRMESSSEPIIRRVEPISETAASFGIWRGKRCFWNSEPFSFMGVPQRLLCGENPSRFLEALEVFTGEI